MKGNKWLTGFLSSFLSCLLAFGAVMCLQSAFSLPARVSHVLLGCAISAVLFSVGFSVKWWYVPLLILAPLAGYLWFDGSFANSLEWALYEISGCYNRAYNTGVFYWGAIPQAAESTMALCAMGCGIAFMTAWSICRQKPAILAVMVALLPLAACFVVTDRVPRTVYLYLFLLGVCVLLLNGWTRRRNPKKGNLLTLLVTVPVALALLLLFVFVPRDTYHGQQRADMLLEKVQQWTASANSATGTVSSANHVVELDAAGRLLQTHTPVMTVKAEQSGTLYLRRQSYQRYDGIRWYNEYADDIYAWIHWEQLTDSGQVTVTTQKLYEMQFVPYYAKEAAVNALGITENTGGAYMYTFDCSYLPEGTPSAVYGEDVGPISADAILLPGETVLWAEPLVAELETGDTVKDRAEAIGNYVRSLAAYSRNTPRMPGQQRDFARWFTTEAETGYCVHFATTAAVLLRAAGIQAQYVEGYTVQAKAGEPVTVYEDQAHAWVEYYDPAVGWRILESTPSEGVPGYVHVPQNPQTQPQQQQTPQQTPEQAPSQNEPVVKKKPVSPVLWWILGVLAAAGLVWGQWRLRLRLKTCKLTGGNANQQALLLWRELVRICRLLRKQPERRWYTLAQKAKFSRHVLTVQELAVLTDALDQSRKQLKQKPWYLQPVYMLILAIY